MRENLAFRKEDIDTSDLPPPYTEFDTTSDADPPLTQSIDPPIDLPIQKESRRAQRRQARADRHQARADRRRARAEHRSSRHRRHEPHKLTLKVINEPILLKDSWTGKKCQLETINGPILIEGNLQASDKIYLKTINGQVEVAGSIVAGQACEVETINGSLLVKGNSIVSQDLDVCSTGFEYDGFIEAKTVSIVAGQGKVRLGHLAIGSELDVKASNHSIEVRLEEVRSRSADISLRTVNAPIHLYLPPAFSGDFFLKTNVGFEVHVIPQSKNVGLKYRKGLTHLKEGSLSHDGRTSDTEIHLQTLNAPIHLYI